MSMIKMAMAGLTAVLVAWESQSAPGQQVSEDVSKKLDALMRRLEKQDKIIQAQDEQIRKQELKIQEQDRVIQSLQNQMTNPDMASRSLTRQQEKKVEELVRDYLSKDEHRVSLGLEGATAGYKDGFFLASRE